MSARPFNTFIHDEPALKPLLERVSELGYLQRVVQEYLPRALVHLAQIGSFRDGTLTLVAKNGAAAAKLKQVLPELDEKLSQRLSQPVEVKVSVLADQWAVPSSPRKDKRTMSPAALESMRRLAADLPTSALKEEVVTLLNRQGRRRLKDTD